MSEVIYRILTEETERREMAIKARQKSKKHDWENRFQKIMDLIGEEVEF